MPLEVREIFKYEGAAPRCWAWPIMVVFRNDSQVTAVLLQLPAPADAIYEARSVMTGQALGTVTASALAAGWNAQLANGTRTDVIELRRR